MDENNESVDVSTLDTPPTPTSATISNRETPTPLKNADVVYGRPLTHPLLCFHLVWAAVVQGISFGFWFIRRCLKGP